MHLPGEKEPAIEVVVFVLEDSGLEVPEGEPDALCLDLDLLHAGRLNLKIGHVRADLSDPLQAPPVDDFGVGELPVGGRVEGVLPAAAGASPAVQDQTPPRQTY
jgi:hypothetical protein